MLSKFKLNSSKLKPVKALLDSYQNQEKSCNTDFEIRCKDKNFPVSQARLLDSSDFLYDHVSGWV